MSRRRWSSSRFSAWIVCATWSRFGFTASARSLAAAAAPVFTGFALARAASGLPFFLAGGLKIVYDLALYFRFRNVTLP